MTNDEIKAQAIADVRKAAEAHPINMLAGYKAYALAQREQNIRFGLENAQLRAQVEELRHAPCPTCPKCGWYVCDHSEQSGEVEEEFEGEHFIGTEEIKNIAQVQAAPEEEE